MMSYDLNNCVRKLVVTTTLLAAAAVSPLAGAMNCESDANAVQRSYENYAHSDSLCPSSPISSYHSCTDALQKKYWDAEAAYRACISRS